MAIRKVSERERRKTGVIQRDVRDSEIDMPPCGAQCPVSAEPSHSFAVSLPDLKERMQMKFNMASKSLPRAWGSAGSRL